MWVNFQDYREGRCKDLRTSGGAIAMFEPKEQGEEVSTGMGSV